MTEQNEKKKTIKIPKPKEPKDFETVIKEQAATHKLLEGELRQEVRKVLLARHQELLARVAKEIAEQIDAGGVTPPPKIRESRGGVLRSRK